MELHSLTPPTSTMARPVTLEPRVTMTISRVVGPAADFVLEMLQCGVTPTPDPRFCRNPNSRAGSELVELELELELVNRTDRST